MKKNNNILVSIVITYFKKKKFLIKTLNSIRKQNHKNYEIIFVYDDPNFSDLSFVKKCLQNFKKKKLIINSKNLGVAKSRNKAIKFCKGTYLSFIDADDIWKKNKLSYQINQMKKNLSLFSFTSFGVINSQGIILGKRVVKKDGNYEDLYKSNFIGLSTVMIHQKLYKRISFPILKTQEDLGLWLKIAKDGYKLYHIKKILSYWRNSPNSLSSNVIRKLIDAFNLYYIYENKNFVFSIYSVLVLSLNKLKKIF